MVRYGAMDKQIISVRRRCCYYLWRLLHISDTAPQVDKRRRRRRRIKHFARNEPCVTIMMLNAKIIVLLNNHIVLATAQRAQQTH